MDRDIGGEDGNRVVGGKGEGEERRPGQARPGQARARQGQARQSQARPGQAWSLKLVDFERGNPLISSYGKLTCSLGWGCEVLVLLRFPALLSAAGPHNPTPSPMSTSVFHRMKLVEINSRIHSRPGRARPGQAQAHAWAWLGLAARARGQRGLTPLGGEAQWGEVGLSSVGVRPSGVRPSV